MKLLHVYGEAMIRNSNCIKPYLVNSSLNVAGISGGHGLQSNAVLATNRDLANLQIGAKDPI